MKELDQEERRNLNASRWEELDRRLTEQRMDFDRRMKELERGVADLRREREMDESRLADEGTFKNVVNVHIISSDVNYTTVTTSLTTELAQINEQLADVNKELADVNRSLAEIKADTNANLNAYVDKLRAWQKQAEGVFHELMEPGRISLENLAKVCAENLYHDDVLTTTMSS